MSNQNRKKHKINSEVRFPQVRVIGEGEPKIMSSYEAYQIAKSEDKDLILINESQNPPIVRIEDYNKFLYNIEKVEKEKRKNCAKNDIKEIQLSVDISDHDLKIKSKKAKEFLTRGDKVKCVLSLKGRQKSSPERGKLTITKFIEDVSECGVSEFPLKLEGNRWFVMIKPVKKQSL
jgi:translation initiation factor IF-3